MKHIKHAERKSAKSWGRVGQRTSPDSHQDKVRNKTRSSQPASQMHGRSAAFLSLIKSYDGLLPRNACRSNYGPKILSKGVIITSDLLAARMKARGY